jgi:hypothetical protein
MSRFREFKPGDKVRILADRIEDWQNDCEFTIDFTRRNSGYGIRAAGHPQTLVMTNGETYSGWWFDPAAVCHWARPVPRTPQDTEQPHE